MIDPKKLTISEIKNHFSAGDFSAAELTAAYRAEALKSEDGNIYRELFDDAIAQAEAADERRKQGKSLPTLDGVPIAIKDNILIEGKISRILIAASIPFKPAMITSEINMSGRNSCDNSSAFSPLYATFA